MVIKRVVIQGFKTFAKRTEFVFDPGITAIVGPNGSGKSNIVDAIRWCLGEQSFSLLRSKKTSDVIFSGSDRRARLGMAQVSLTLDNSTGELPLDYAEIEITRRAYRDGDNEYSVNGRRVRLQDITDLLAQTGLGKRTYAVIGQGLIDRVLSMAPEELRSLFEEAAGITGYQAKRGATLRRLEAADHNLSLVQDILAELTPRLAHLRRQAERAQERARLTDELRTLLRDWYGYHWHATLAELELRRATANQAQAKVDVARTALAAVGAQIEQLRNKQTTLRGVLGEQHRAGSRLHREAEQVSRELAVGQERLRQITERREETHRELSTLAVQSQALAVSLDESTAALTAGAATHRDLQAQLQAAQTELAARQQTRQAHEQQLGQARRHLEQLQTLLADNTGRRRQLAERQAALVQAQQEESAALAQDEASVRDLTHELAARRAELAELDAQLHAKQTHLVELERQLAIAQQAIAPAQAQQRNAERNLDRLQTRYDLLTRLNQEGAGFGGAVRAVLQAASAQPRPRLEGILGVVASLVRVPAHLDKAIETALGGALQNIVTQRWSDTSAAIEFLKEQRAGRATFLPLDRLSVLPAIPAPALAGVLGNAADLVSYDPPVADAIHQLLNRVWIVRDLATARLALDRHANGPRPTVVTLDGDIVRPGGAVTGGSEQTRRDDSVLARARELRELPDQIAAAEQTVAAAVAHITDADRTVTAVVHMLATAQTDLKAHQARLQGPRTHLADVERRLDRARQAAQWRRERLAQLAEEATRMAAQDAQLAAQASEAENARATAAQALAALQDTATQDQTEELLRKLADLRAAAAAAATAQQAHTIAHADLTRRHRAVTDQLRTRQEQLAHLEQERSALDARLATLTAQEQTLRAQLAALQQQIEPGEAELARLEAAQSQHENRERLAQEQLRRDESAWSSAQLHLQRTEDTVNRLRQDIEQDLGLVLLEVGDDLAYQPPLPWDAVVEQLQPRHDLPEGLETEIRDLRARLGRIVNVNPDAPREFAEATTRHHDLATQSADLQAAIADLRKIVRELDVLMEGELSRTFSAVAEQFVHFFERLFNGGTAKLTLTDPDHIAQSGIEIIARPPGKRPQSLALLSGGERTLAACALIFAILRVSPTPFCILDEVDAALDEANVDRFRVVLQELSQETQFILITHNRRTLEGANAIYGVTMGGDSASRVISLRLEAVMHFGPRA